MRVFDKTLRMCGCGATFETIADDPPEACPTCTRERNLRLQRDWRMKRAEEVSWALKDWTLVSDACDMPMRPGARLSRMEVGYGIEYGGLVPGTRLRKGDAEYIVDENGLVPVK